MSELSHDDQRISSLGDVRQLAFLVVDVLTEEITQWIS